MKRLIVLLPLFLLIGCSSVEQNARDTAFALDAVVKTAQDKYLDSCQASPQQDACVRINRAVDAENALTTAIRAYCQFPAGTVDPTAKCVPVRTAEDALRTATENAAEFITDLKGVL